jgi:hypothetical protein
MKRVSLCSIGECHRRPGVRPFRSSISTFKTARHTAQTAATPTTAIRYSQFPPCKRPNLLLAALRTPKQPKKLSTSKAYPMPCGCASRVFGFENPEHITSDASSPIHFLSHCRRPANQTRVNSHFLRFSRVLFEFSVRELNVLIALQISNRAATLTSTRTGESPAFLLPKRRSPARKKAIFSNGRSAQK